MDDAAPLTPGQLAQMESRLRMLEAENARLRAGLTPETSALLLLLNESADAHVALDAEGRVTWMNAAAESLWGHPSNAARGHTLEELDPRWAGAAFISRTRQTGEPRQRTEFDYALEERQKWFHVRMVPHSDGAVFACQDVSAQRQAEQPQQQTETMLRSFLEGSPIGIAIWDADLQPLLVNPAMSRAGLPGEASASGALGAPLRRALATGAPEPGIEWQSGAEESFYLAHVWPLPSASGPVGVAAMVWDITAAKQTEHSLRSSEERLRIALDAAGIGDWNSCPETGEFVASPQALALHGLPPDTVLTDSTARQMVHPLDRERVKRAVQACLEGNGDYEAEYRVAQTGAEPQWLLASARWLRRDAGQPGRLYGIVQDVTVRRTADQALRRALADLEQLAFGASHDLQEPLRTMISYTQLLTRRYQHTLDDDAREFLQYVSDAAERMRLLLRDLMTYARTASIQEVDASEADCEGVLAFTLANLDAQISESQARVSHSRLPVVRADMTQLSQVFQNLISNSIKFRHPERAPEIRLGAECRAEEWQISIYDNGQGFPADQAERIFGLFKRAHARNLSGSGIGLAICQRIIERHGGRIWAEAQEGAGAAFHFTLPAKCEPETHGS